MRAISIASCLLTAVLLAGVPPHLDAEPYLGVRHGAAYLYLPLATPARPPDDAPADWGFLGIDVLPADAEVYVDGHAVGEARQFGGGEGMLALPPGRHRIEIQRAGFQPVRLTFEIGRRQTHVYGARLVPDPTASRDQAGGGYHVVPPAASAPSASTRGGGYHVIPRP
jgi:hypothetical protein